MNGLPGKKMSEDAPNADQSIGIESQKNNIPYGYCHCGCGNTTNLRSRTNKKRGHLKGEPYLFMSGHNLKRFPRIGKDNPRWKAGIINSHRIRILKPEHPRADNTYGYVLLYVLIAEQALGKPLPQKAVIHHFDCDPKNNKNKNLAICENQAYHLLLHQRMRAFRACGDAHWRKCKYCKQYDDPKDLYILPEGNSAYHKMCFNCHRRFYKLIKEA